MTNKPLIWRIVLAIVVVGVLVAAGFGIYQLGFRNGILTAGPGMGMFPGEIGHFDFFFGEDNSFHQPFGGHRVTIPDKDNWYPMPSQKGSGYPDKDLYKKKLYYQSYPLKSKVYFSPFSLVMRFVALGVLLWLFYKVITLFTQGNGWQLSFTRNESGDVKEKTKKK